MALKYYCDSYRHLICLPYSIPDLHTMAQKLNIKRCHFHKNHYDIPKRRIDEIMKQCVIVASRFIVDAIKYGVQYNDSYNQNSC